jgi:hypothetical protein
MDSSRRRARAHKLALAVSLAATVAAAAPAAADVGIPTPPSGLLGSSPVSGLISPVASLVPVVLFAEPTPQQLKDPLGTVFSDALSYSPIALGPIENAGTIVHGYLDPQTGIISTLTGAILGRATSSPTERSTSAPAAPATGATPVVAFDVTRYCRAFAHGRTRAHCIATMSALATGREGSLAHACGHFGRRHRRACVAAARRMLADLTAAR